MWYVIIYVQEKGEKSDNNILHRMSEDKYYKSRRVLISQMMICLIFQRFY